MLSPQIARQTLKVFHFELVHSNSRQVCRTMAMYHAAGQAWAHVRDALTTADRPINQNKYSRSSSIHQIHTAHSYFLDTASTHTRIPTPTHIPTCPYPYPSPFPLPLPISLPLLMLSNDQHDVL